MARTNHEQTIAHALRMNSDGSEILPKAEKLVGMGFRCWLSGYQDGTIENWQACWTYYSRELGSRHAREAITELSSWVNAVHSHAVRRIELRPANCPGFCRDECLAVSLVAASRHGACPAMQACAQALLGAEQIEPVLKTASHFAITLETVGISFGSELRMTH